MQPWKPTHCLRGEAPLPVALIEDKDGTVVYHDGFVANVRMGSETFHKLYIPIEDYGKRPPRKKKAANPGKQALLKALETGGPLPSATELAKRGKKKPKPGWKPKNSTDFFV